MGFELIQGGLGVGLLNPNGVTAPAFGSGLTLSAAAHRVAMIIVPPRDGTLDLVEFRTGSVSAGDPINGMIISFQGLDANGNPDNTDDQFRQINVGSIASNTWTIPGLITDDGTDGGVKRVVVAGVPFAVVLKFTTFVAGDSVSIANIGTTQTADMSRRTTDSGTTWTRSGQPLTIALKYDDGYEFINPYIWPVTGFNATTFNTGTNPDEMGLRFLIPFDFEFGGISFATLCASVSQVNTVKLYSFDDTVLDTVTYVHGQFTDVNGFAWVHLPMSRFSPCQGGAIHRVTVTAGGASNVSMYSPTVPSNDYLAAYNGGIEHYLTQRENAGAWVDTLTRRPFMQLHLTRINAVAAGGGGKAVYLS